MTTSNPHTAPKARALFEPVDFGAVHANNRIVLAPLTRLRSGEEGVPGDLVVEYYRQRASTGMILTEGTWPVREGRTWIGQPGIETAEQLRGWTRVADAVHAVGGSIAMQIMHGGRVSHPALTGTGRIVAPSRTAGPNPIRIPHKVEPPVAQALTIDEIRLTIRQFVDAAKRARTPGWTRWRSTAPTDTSSTNSSPLRRITAPTPTEAPRRTGHAMPSTSPKQ